MVCREGSWVRKCGLKFSGLHKIRAEANVIALTQLRCDNDKRCGHGETWPLKDKSLKKTDAFELKWYCRMGGTRDIINEYDSLISDTLFEQMLTSQTIYAIIRRNMSRGGPITQ